MFFLKLILTGLITGILGYFLIERWLKNYLQGLSLNGQIKAVLILGFLYAVAFASIFAGLIADLMQTNVFVVWLFLLPGIFSTNTLIIMIVVFSVVFVEGYKEFASYAYEVLAPLVAGTLGFLFGLIKPQNYTMLFFDPGAIATINFMAGLFGGALSAGIAYITAKVLNSLSPNFD